MDELEKINQQYEEISNGTYPFIFTHKITVIKAGFYQKNKADYRGLSLVYDKRDKKHKALLVGYFYVPENYIIIPPGLKLSEGKRKLVRDKLNAGYKIIDRISLKPYEFAEDSKEFEIAKEVNRQYKAQRV